jgi:hypothetical protein
MDQAFINLGSISMNLFKKNDFFYANGITTEEKDFYFPKQEKVVSPPDPDENTLSDKFWDWLYYLLNPNIPEGCVFHWHCNRKYGLKKKICRVLLYTRPEYRRGMKEWNVGLIGHSEKYICLYKETGKIAIEDVAALFRGEPWQQETDLTLRDFFAQLTKSEQQGDTPFL